ncbi:MAG: SRPBCC family protein [Desulfobacteraceae bacterium]|nr:MAG: SRPBCC family protein [Desulfobacteraceae bacterium]
MAVEWHHRHLLHYAVGLLVLALASMHGTAPGAEGASAAAIEITRPAPDARGGQAYLLSYRVEVPLEVYWRFKTDFENAYLESIPHLLSHRLISREDAEVITEDRYSMMPDAFFRWRTRIAAARHRLEFELIKTNQPGHKFHYGFIQLEAENGATRVTQTAYFDFWGASFWSRYPWRGGMNSFLRDTAEWEQRTAVRLRHRYESSLNENSR